MEVKKITETTPDEVFVKNLMFSNKNGVELHIDEIIKKKITTVVIAYLSRERIDKLSGLKGLLGFKKRSQENRIITIEDKSGILLYYIPGIESASIRFFQKDQFNKIVNFDEKTIKKRYSVNPTHLHQVNFNILNLIEVDWED